MTANQFRAMKDRSGYLEACAQRENFGALQEIQAFEKYLDKEVKVVKGRKIPIGTTGTVFWIGMRNYSKYGYWFEDGDYESELPQDDRFSIELEEEESSFLAEVYYG